ncbi:MAG: hypothetical protein IGBAC_0466 [Ignavibacteriae bacterium]|nr:MAG: hypothetical protein IGBAC_0466 [Ignavibacteriota bacterium]
MNKTLAICFLIAIFASQPIISQTTEEQKLKEPSTKIGAFLAKKGKVVVKDFYRLGTVKGNFGSSMEFSALVIYEPGRESERLRGLKVEINGGGRYERNNSSFLDFDEVESYSKAVSYLTQTASSWKAGSKEYTEVIFSTKDDFSFGFYQKGTEQTCFSESGYVGKATCFFDVDDLKAIQQIVDKAKSLLTQK